MSPILPDSTATGRPGYSEFRSFAGSRLVGSKHGAHRSACGASQDGTVTNEGELLCYVEDSTCQPDIGPSVLTLDGGGCRGFITLLVLLKQLRLVQPQGLIYPYLYFDLICGTSTGGLIAILLGVLRLDIETVIKIYAVLARKVFLKGYSIRRYFKKDAGYSSKPLEAAVDEILKEHGGGRTLMVDPDKGERCRVFVTTTHCDGVRREVTLVRSYPNPEGGHAKGYDHLWTIKNAALATAAAPAYFGRHAVTVNGTEFFFEDAGAHCANNPTKMAWKECQRLSDLKGRSPLFVSLGTGSAPSQPTSGFFGFFKNKIDTFKALVEYATDVHRVHRQMKKRADESETKFYFRLDPPLDENITLDKWKELPAMRGIAEEYYTNNDSEFREIAEHLAKRFQKATQGPSGRMDHDLRPVKLSVA